MPIDWEREARPDTVADLVARKKFGRAIEVVRRRLETQPRNLSMRLQLANIFVQAGRGPEAVPLFIALADDFAADGFLARAIAALKQAEKLEPGRADVELRLQSLSRERALETPRPPVAGPRPTPPPVLAPEAVAKPDDPPGTTGSSSINPTPAEAPKPLPPPSEGRVKSRLRGVFRRLFGSEGGEEDDAPAEAEPAEDRAADTALPEGAAEATSTVPLDQTLTPVPPVGSAGTVEPAERPAFADEDTRPEFQLPEPALVRRARREPTPGEEFLSMPEDALLDRFDDLFEDILQPLGGPVAPPSAVEAELPSADASSPSPGGLTGLMFDELGPDERLAVLRGLKLRTFEPGDVLVTEGEPPSGLYLLTAGGVKLYVRDAESRNHPLGSLDEGDFFGEIASRSGLPRNATVVATALGEMLELEQASLDRIAQSHPRVWERMNTFARERAASRKAAEESTHAPGPNELPLDPKLRLRLASAFLRAGQREEALPILLDLADELVRRGEGDKAVALLKKVERIRSGGPLRAGSDKPARPPGSARSRPITDDRLGQWLKGMAKTSSRARPTQPAPRLWADRLAEPETLRAYAGLRDCRLFDDLSEEALLTLLQRLPLESFEPGDIVLTEGEPGDSVLVVGVGRVKVFLRQRSGRDALVRELGEGAFIGEIGALAGLPRTATATASAPSLLLRIGRKPLETLCRAHPPARKVLEEVLAARTASLEEAARRDDPGEG